MKTSKSDSTEELADHQLFQQAMQDVTPLKQDSVPVISTVIQRRHPSGYLKKVRRKHSQPQQTPLCFQEIDSTAPIGAFEAIQHSEKGLRPRDFAKLKNSDFSLDAVLDLHGKTAEEAEWAIEHFVQQAIHCEMKYIRIIHGKGYNSENAHPVLKNICYQKLKSYRNVVAFCSTPERDGGVGAVNIQLRV